MALLKQSTAYTRMFLIVQSSDHTTGLTGQQASCAVQLSKNGGAFAPNSGGNPAIAEVNFGWYKVNLSIADTNLSLPVNTQADLAYHITATGGDPTDFADQVATNIFTDLGLDTSGNAFIVANFKKNQPTVLPFEMTSGNPPVPTPLLTVSAQRSLGGAGFAPCGNLVTEIGLGCYTINLTASDTNANVILYHFSAVGANDQNITVWTTP